MRKYETEEAVSHRRTQKVPALKSQERHYIDPCNVMLPVSNLSTHSITSQEINRSGAGSRSPKIFFMAAFLYYCAALNIYKKIY